MRVSTRIALLAVIGTQLSSCSTSPFYNEARDKQGQALVQAADKFELASLVDGLDKRFAALRALELQTLRARQSTQRDLEIASAVSPGAGGKGTLSTRYVSPFVDRRIEQLVGRTMDAQALDAVLTGVVDDEHADAQVASALRTFGAASTLKVADCPAARGLTNSAGLIKPEVLTKIPTNQRSGAQALMKNLLARCATAEKAKPFSGESGGELQRISSLQLQAEGEVERYRTAVALHRKALQLAMAAYQREVDLATPKDSDASASARATSAAVALDAAVVAARQAAELGGAAGHGEAIERLAALETVTTALASGSTDLSELDPGQRRAVGLVRSIAGIGDEIDAVVTASRKPRLAPLLLALDQQRLMVKGFEDRLALLERRVGLRSAQLDAARSELQALARARRALGPPTSPAIDVTVDLNQSLDAALADSADGSRRRAALFESLAMRFDVAEHHRRRAAELELAYNGTTDDLVMLQSRTAAAQWSSLLKQVAAVLAEHHAAGIKPADLAEFLKGFGLVTIGTSVSN
jgi:hypothetical protein